MATVLLLLVLVGQVRTSDACDLELGNSSDDVTFSDMDDAFVANVLLVSPLGDLPSSGKSLLLPPLTPAGRLVVSDLFRPPISPRI